MNSTAEHYCESCGELLTLEQGRDVSEGRAPCPVCGDTSRAVTVRQTGPVETVAEVENPKRSSDDE